MLDDVIDVISVGNEAEWNEYGSLWYRAVDCVGVSSCVTENE